MSGRKCRTERHPRDREQLLESMGAGEDWVQNGPPQEPRLKKDQTSRISTALTVPLRTGSWFQLEQWVGPARESAAVKSLASEWKDMGFSLVSATEPAFEDCHCSEPLSLVQGEGDAH